jgi:deoxycitidine kinase/deoxyguanosine kinase
MKRPQIITVEGNIGAGKSTLLENMKERYKDRHDILFLQEPVDTWSQIKENGKTILELFYENKLHYSFPFQVLAYTTRLRIIRDSIEKAMESRIIQTIVMERSLEADRKIFAQMLFDDQLIDSCNFDIYKMMSDDGLKYYSADKIIWLNTKPNECLNRIRRRKREGEENIDIHYLNRCDAYHTNWLSESAVHPNGPSPKSIFVIENDMVDWGNLELYIQDFV